MFRRVEGVLGENPLLPQHRPAAPGLLGSLLDVLDEPAYLGLPLRRAEIVPAGDRGELEGFNGGEEVNRSMFVSADPRYFSSPIRVLI